MLVWWILWARGRFVATGSASPLVLGDGLARYVTSGEVRGGVKTTFHAGLKNADLQTNVSAVPSASRTYDAFGNVVGATGTWRSPFGHAGPFGYQSDADTGFQLLGHRYYDPSTGRFLTRDPAKDGRNWYVYCNSNPVNLVDPRGLAPMGPPPIPIPGTTNNYNWKWSPDPGNSRVGRWVPAVPMKNEGGGQPHASWDPLGHWDVDNGDGTRNRYTKVGKPISPAYAHTDGAAHYARGWGKHLRRGIPILALLAFFQTAHAEGVGAALGDLVYKREIEYVGNRVAQAGADFAEAGEEAARNFYRNRVPGLDGDLFNPFEE